MWNLYLSELTYVVLFLLFCPGEEGMGLREYVLLYVSFRSLLPSNTLETMLDPINVNGSIGIHQYMFEKLSEKSCYGSSINKSHNSTVNNA